MATVNEMIDPRVEVEPMVRHTESEVTMSHLS